jgi:hypothetical protein
VLFSAFAENSTFSEIYASFHQIAIFQQMLKLHLAEFRLIFGALPLKAMHRLDHHGIWSASGRRR